MTAAAAPAGQDGQPPTLAIDGLRIEIAGQRGRAVVVDAVSLRIWPGEIVGLIGESGSGKTMIALSILGLLPSAARIASGSIALRGRAISGLSEPALRQLRGDRLALVPQDALRALNPVQRVGRQVGEPFVIHRRWRRRRSEAAAVELLGSVHLPDPGARAQDYPHQFSGGMQQRAMIAMGLALEPELLIADEPTTALDVTVQAQVLRLLREIRDARGTAMLFVTHDLAVVSQLCDRIYVIYAGQIVEAGSRDAIFRRPRHPYTRALLQATPTIRTRPGALAGIPGQIPSPFAMPPGCRFAARCPQRMERCATPPPLVARSGGEAVRCWLETA
jgi:oligopeptide/dipeptide ABC transporter ATP-binding protein